MGVSGFKVTPVVFVGVESVIAEAALALEKEEEALRDAERQSRSVARTRARRALAEKRQAAAWNLAAGVMSGAASVASGAFGAASAGGQGVAYRQEATARRYTAVVEGVGDVGAAGFRFLAEQAAARAENESAAADELRGLAEDHEGQVEQVARMRERALQHLQAVADARVRSAEAALRA